eukprot:352122-Chlamydomonas_euryale.AAC.10
MPGGLSSHATRTRQDSSPLQQTRERLPVGLNTRASCWVGYVGLLVNWMRGASCWAEHVGFLVRQYARGFLCG